MQKPNLIHVDEDEDGRKFWNYTIYGFFPVELTDTQLDKINDLLLSIGDPKLVIDALNFGYHRKLCDRLHKENRGRFRGRPNMVQNFMKVHARSKERAEEWLAKWKETSKRLKEGQFFLGNKNRIPASSVTIWRIKKALQKKAEL